MRVLAGILLLIVALVLPSHAQSPDLLFEDADLTDVFADLPAGFDLDIADAAAFASLPSISPEDAARIVDAREALPQGMHLADALETIPGLTGFQRAILAHLADQPPRQGDGALIRLPTELAFRTGYRLGDTPAGLGGYYARAVIGGESPFTGSLLLERDESEPRALDHASGGVRFTAASGRVGVTMGDYRFGIGQGLLLSRYGLRFLSGADAGRPEPDRVLNTSFEESRAFRGLHVTAGGARGKVTAWFSDRSLDATVNAEGEVVTIRDSGLHLPGDTGVDLDERVMGLRAVFRAGDRFDLGITGMTTGYEPALDRRSGEADFNDPVGGSFTHIGVDGTCVIPGGGVWWEYSRMNGGSAAAAAGIGMEGGRVRTALALRRYDPGYRAFRSGGIASFGGVENESGAYAAVDARIARGIGATAGIDLARTETRTSVAVSPVQRRRLYAAADIALPRKVRMHAAWREVRDDIGDTRRNGSVRVESRWNGISWRALAALSAGGGEAGPCGDLRLTCRLGPFRVDCSTAAFDIPAYAARFYRYDLDVPGRGMARPVWGRGVTGTVVVRVQGLSVRWRGSDADLMGRDSEVALQFDHSW